MRKIGILLFALALGGSANVQAQSLKDLYPVDAEVVVTPLPFAWEKCSPYLDPVVDFMWGKGKGLPLFSYSDLNGTVQNTEDGEFTHVFRHFELPEQGCEVLAVSVERSHDIRQLLLVYKDGKLTDCLEAGISTNDELATKQWKIGADGTVEIYSLKVLGDRSILTDEDFDTVRMQREDDVYQIDGKGKFKRVEKAKFPAREYSKAELQDKETNIWNF